MLKLYQLFFLLLLFVNSTGNSQAFEINRYIDLPITWENSYVSGKLKDGTQLNPENNIVDIEKSSIQSAVQWFGHYRGDHFSIKSDIWTMLHQGKKSDFEVFVSEALLEYKNSDHFSLSMGKRVIKWGPGYIWNPSNPFKDSRSNNTDKSRLFKKEGDNSLNLELNEGNLNWTLFSVEHVLEEQIDENFEIKKKGIGMHLEYFFNNADATLSLISLEENPFVSASISTIIGNHLEIHAEGSARKGSDKYYPSFNQSPSLPEAYSFYTFQADKGEKYYSQFLLGSQYTFMNFVNIILEYFYDGTGYSSEQFGLLQDGAKYSEKYTEHPVMGKAHKGYLAQSNNLLGMMRRHYLFARLSYDYENLGIQLRVYNRLGLEDWSQISGTVIIYSMSEFSDLKFGFEHYGGSKKSESNLLPQDYSFSSSISLIF